MRYLTYAVRVSSDSIAPAIQDGDVLLCPPQSQKVNSGDVVIAVIPDGEFVKCVKKTRGKLALVNYNP